MSVFQSSRQTTPDSIIQTPGYSFGGNICIGGKHVS